jgi:hypothetical protein
MSNLSFARIMYGSNEDASVSTWMHSSSLRSQPPGSPVPGAVSSQNWMQKLLSAVMPNGESRAPNSSKSIS